MTTESVRMDFQSLKFRTGQLKEGIERLEEKNKQLEKEIQQLKAKGAQAQARNVPMEAVGSFHFYSIRFDEPADPMVLRSSTDAIRKADPEAIICLADSEGMFVATSGNTAQKMGIGANVMVKLATETAGGSGGGRPEMAQGRLKEPAKFPEVLDRIKKFIIEQAKG